MTEYVTANMVSALIQLGDAHGGACLRLSYFENDIFVEALSREGDVLRFVEWTLPKGIDITEELNRAIELTIKGVLSDASHRPS